jgi:O-antigen ligase
VVFFFLSGGVILIIGDVESSMLAKLFWGVVYAISGLLVFQYSRLVLYVVERNCGFMLLALLCLFSVAWSSDRPATLSSSIGMVGTTLLGYLLAAKLEPLQFFRPAAVALFVLITINVVLMLPNLGANLSGAVRYRGIFTHPNILGRNTGMAILLLAILSLSRSFPRFWGAIGVGMGVLLLISCGSMTSVLSLSVALGLFIICKSIGGPVGSGIIAVVLWFILCVGGLVWLNWASIIDFTFGLLGRSPTLTGRTPLWEGVSDAILRRPWLGYGYSAFWSGETLIGTSILDSAGWTTSSAHNGILDISLGLGLVGVTIFVVTVGRATINGFKLAFREQKTHSLLVLPILTYLLMIGLTESTYLQHNSEKWVLLLVCSVYVRRIRDGEFESDSF